MKATKPPTKRQITDELLELLWEHLESAGVKIDTGFTPPSGRAIKISADEQNRIGEITVDGYNIIFEASPDISRRVGNRVENIVVSAYEPNGTQQIEDAILGISNKHARRKKIIDNIAKWVEFNRWIAKPIATFSEYLVDVYLYYDSDSNWSHTGKVGRIRLYGNNRVCVVANPENGQWGESSFPVIWSSPPNNMIDVGFKKNKQEIYNLFVAATWKKWERRYG
jgi:hypothetical protein